MSYHCRLCQRCIINVACVVIRGLHLSVLHHLLPSPRSVPSSSGLASVIVTSWSCLTCQCCLLLLGMSVLLLRDCVNFFLKFWVGLCAGLSCMIKVLPCSPLHCQGLCLCVVWPCLALSWCVCVCHSWPVLHGQVLMCLVKFCTANALGV